MRISWCSPGRYYMIINPGSDWWPHKYLVANIVDSKYPRGFIRAMSDSDFVIQCDEKGIRYCKNRSGNRSVNPDQLTLAILSSVDLHEIHHI